MSTEPIEFREENGVWRPVWPATGLVGHELAGIFRLLDRDELHELAGLIAANGLRQQIVMLDGKILDGRNRYLASIIAGRFGPDVAWQGHPDFIGFGGMGWDQGSDPLEFVWDTNAGRRHDGPSQRALAAAQYARLKAARGGDTSDDAANLRPTQAEAAEKMGVSERSVNSAEAVLKTGSENLIEAVERGAVAISTAAEIAALPEDEQKEVVAAGGRKEIREAAKQAVAKKRPDLPIPTRFELDTFGVVKTIAIGGFRGDGEASIDVRLDLDDTIAASLDFQFRSGNGWGHAEPFERGFPSLDATLGHFAWRLIEDFREVVNATSSVVVPDQRQAASRAIAWIEKWAAEWDFVIEAYAGDRGEPEPEAAASAAPADVGVAEEADDEPTEVEDPVAEEQPWPATRYMPKQGRPYVVFAAQILQHVSNHGSIDDDRVFELASNVGILDEEGEFTVDFEQHIRDIGGLPETIEFPSVAALSGNLPSPAATGADAMAEQDGGEGTGSAPALPADPLSVEEADAIIRQGYLDKVSVADLAALIGRPGNKAYVRNRARVMEISSRERQREAASAFATAQHAGKRGEDA